ncbi:Site-specific recombinase XerD [Pedococcus dokdonensis]|uniref:Site-specific recombinase XerD n=1 Tax=Pedococcus dokdonensis TaxID=443156 RepID=A0A1H0SXX4_9MICO|nr:site-specific integrase [Pedococcus dokdonensis]SDP46524.1 Site-specific recombinase XerD [Pedococcus dokdonensis]
MAWVEKRPGGYIGRYRLDGRAKSTTVFKRKRDATEAAEEAERQGKLGEHIDRRKGRITVEEWSQRWLDSLHVSPKTRSTYEELLSSLILPTWGRVPLNQVSLSEVKKWVANMEGPRGPVSASRKHAASSQLVRMLDAAVDEWIILNNPARTASGKANYRPSPKRHKAHRYLSHAELEALALAAGDHGAMIRLAGLTGLRWGEITALRVRDVDSLHGRITVERAFSIVGGKKVLGPPKTHERRTVTFPRSLGEQLTAQAAGRGKNDLLFSTRTGEPLDNANFSKQILTQAWKMAGIDRLTFHDLRHTAASLAVQAGGNVKTVQNMLGHASATMTLDTYAGLFETDAQALADKMDAARSAAMVTV